MANQEIINVEVEETALTRKPTDAGSVRTASPQGIEKESWRGLYVDHTQANIHRVIEDALNGEGGFKGDIPNSSSDYNNANSGAYSYMQAKSSELQWRSRVKNGGYTNHYGRYISSMVEPIFSDRFNYTVDSGTEHSGFEAFWKNATGGGISYREVLRYSLTQLRAHDVVFLVMDVIEGEPVIYARSVVHVNENYLDSEKGKLSQIAFFDGTSQDGKTTYQRLWWFNGTTHTMRMEARTVLNKSWMDLEYEPASGEEGAEINTGIPEFSVKAHLVGYHNQGVFIPENPKSKKVLEPCIYYWFAENRSDWLHNMNDNPIIAAFSHSTIKGINGTLGNMLNFVSDANGLFPPEPVVVQPTAGNITASQTNLDRKLNSLRDIIRENGVTTKESGTAQSGESKKYDYIATNDALKNTVEMAREIDEWVFMMYNILTNSSVEYVVSYPEEFFPEEDYTVEEIDTVVNMLAARGATKTASKVLSMLVKKVLGKDVSQDELKEIDDEIESLNMEQEDIVNG